MTRLLDLVLAGFVLAGGSLFLLPLAAFFRATAWIRRAGPRRILYLGTGQIAQVFPRNGVNLFLERETSDFGGFFEQLWNVHFPAGTRGTLDLTPRHHLVDFDIEVPAWLRPFPRASIALREIAFLSWLFPFARRQRISIATATNPYLQGLNALLLAIALGLPYGVIITRDFDWDWAVLRKQAFPSVFPSRRVETWVARLVLSSAALVLADRAYYRDFALRNGARPERTVATRVMADRAYEGARPSAALRQRYGVAKGAPLLVYVGRLDVDKFAMDLVECLALARGEFPTTTLLCAGSGSLEEPMRRRAGELGVGAGLLLPGSVPLEELPHLIASADLVVAGHMGYTLVEAGLTGTPIVTYDYDYHAEILENGVSGFLAPFRDVPALAELVCQVLRNPELGRRAGALTRERLLREHSVEAVTLLYRAAYARVLPPA